MLPRVSEKNSRNLISDRFSHDWGVPSEADAMQPKYIFRTRKSEQYPVPDFVGMVSVRWPIDLSAAHTLSAYAPLRFAAISGHLGVPGVDARGSFGVLTATSRATSRYLATLVVSPVIAYLVPVKPNCTISRGSRLSP